MPSDSTSSSEPILHVCLLWHQHQPYYRLGEKFLLPWVWLHSTKDYLEMAQHVEAVPGMRATINLTPVLLKQIEEYLSGEGHDPILDCMRKPATMLTLQEKQFMIDEFFLANEEHIISRSNRYKELLAKARALPRTDAVDPSSFSDEAFRDLAVHFALAWTGEFAREIDPAKKLIAKDRGFSEEEKASLLDYHRELVKRIVPLHKRLSELGQIELTTSPFYHPILPLLIDSSSAEEQMPGITLPHVNFHHAEDAKTQLERGSAYFQQEFGVAPSGLWPSEGSISEAALGGAAQAGYRWVATDERILDRSLEKGNNWVEHREVAKYFPWVYQTPAGPVGIFFRNQWLSDKIGFDYQAWQADDAVGDFIRNLLSIRQNILDVYGDQGLHAASVNIILDGENCWEFYPNNGREFLSKLYHALVNTQGIAPSHFSDVLQAAGDGSHRTLSQVASGSWINGNFAIWIGGPQENAAWDALASARRNFDSFCERADNSAETKAIIALALEELLIAEGSDWFWWYGDKHFSVNQDTFDELFRAHLRAMYVHLDERVPEALAFPFALQVAGAVDSLRPSGDGRISPELLGAESAAGWENSKRFEYKSASAMHRATSKGISVIRVGWNEKDIFVRILPDEDMISSVRFEFATPPGVDIEVWHDRFRMTRTIEATPIAVTGRGILRDTAEVAFPRELLDGEETLMFAVHLEYEAGRTARLPHSDWFECKING